MNENVTPIKAQNRLPEGKEIGVVCQTLGQSADALHKIASAYANTNQPSLREIADLLFHATVQIASTIQFMGVNINQIAKKYEIKVPTPQPPAA